MGNSSSKDSSLSVRDLMLNYTSDLPKVVSITGNNSNTQCLTKGKVLGLQFIKETNVVIIEDDSKCKYFVPVQSSILGSVLYNPHHDRERAKRGSWFRGVHKLLESFPQPKVVFVERGCNHLCSDSTACASKEGAILAIQNIDKDHTSGETILSCVDVKSGRIWYLSNFCKAIFSTRVSKLKVEIKNIFRYVKSPFSAILYLKHDSHFKFPCNIATSKVFKAKSVIASVHSPDKVNLRPESIVEVMTDSSIDVKIPPIDVAKCVTPNIQFSPRSVTEVLGSGSSILNTKLQTRLFQSIDPNGFLLHPITSDKTLVVQHLTKTASAESLCMHIYETIRMREDGIHTYVNHTLQRAESFNISESGEESDENDEEYVDMTKWVDSPDTIQYCTSKESTDKRIEINKQLLARCTTKDVLMILTALNIPSEYKDAFKREEVTGGVLLECDEELLKEELGLYRKIDRIKVLRVIEGHHDIDFLLNQQ